MAIYKIPFSVLTLIFIPIFPFISSLSTIAISETANQTLICATIQSPNQSPYLNCTTFPDQNQTPLSLSNTSVSGIVGGNGFLCSISSPSSATSSNNVSMGCWRFSPNGTNTISYTYKRIYRGPPLKELKAGDSHICGLIRGTGDLVCWQWRRLDTSMNRNIFKKIAVGRDFICGLSEFGNITCLQEENGSNNGSIVRYTPSGNYSVIGAGFYHACAISVNGSLICWGENVGEYPQGYEFTTLALGDNRSCAIRANGTVVCWGEGNFSLPLNLKNTYFVAIEAKGRVFCGIVSSNYSLYCWGNEFLETNPRVFDNVVPGACISTCPCSRPLPGYGSYCSGDMMICEPCISQTPQVVPPVVQAAPPQSLAKRGGWGNRMVVFLVVGCVGSTTLVIVGCFLFCKYCKYRKCQVHDSGPLDEEGRLTPIPVIQKRPSKLLSINSGCGHLEEFSLQVLNQHTNNFSDDQKVGTGSFGSVYSATLDDGRQVAIKRAEASSSSSHAHNDNEEDKDSAFMNELEFLSRLNHKNLVRLLGYCKDSDERILVYEYMCKGTLNDHLHKTVSNNDSSPLTMSWAGRLKIALDTARGIEYLHVYANPPIIHRDIKSSNILLDAMWTAKVSDFGLSLIGPRDEDLHLSIPAAGTMGYLDPEYYRTQQLTTKSDVYSFGVVLLELLTGRKAIHNNENGVPRNVIDFVTPYIAQDEIHRALDRNVPPPTPFEIEGVAYVGYLAANCVALQGRDRPTMTKVVHSLERALAACLAPPQILSRSSTESST